MKRKLIIINPGQFGYQAGYYYYCKYLKDDFIITFVCNDQGMSKIELHGITVKYIDYSGNKIKRHFKWLIAIYEELNHNNYDIIFIVYFRLCFIIPLLFDSKKIILDIRTGSLHSSKIINWLHNRAILFETYFFKKITILSKKLIDVIGLNNKKCYWLPLGAERQSSIQKSYDNIKLLYVGVFNNRKIFDTIEGLYLFIQANPEVECNITYDIVGFGSSKELELLNEYINMYKLKAIVKLHGRKNLLEIGHFFEKCNVGVSYIPITEYYNFQPPTKTF